MISVLAQRRRFGRNSGFVLQGMARWGQPCAASMAGQRVQRDVVLSRDAVQLVARVVREEIGDRIVRRALEHRIAA